MEGKIIKVNRHRGYGFIRTESEEVYFFHHSDLMIEIDIVKEGDLVEFRLDYGPRGLVDVRITLATSIKIIDY